MARHMEHPGIRHSNPASRKTSAMPSSSAFMATHSEPGTTRALTPFFTLCPLRWRATSRRSESLALVQLPMKATWTVTPWMGWPGLKPM